MSGIGHATFEIIKFLNKKFEGTTHSITAVVPYGRKQYVTKYNWKNVNVRQLPPGYKYVNYLLVRTSLPIPVDLFFGRGIYIFPNYKNWYVPFSRSITFVHDVVYRLLPDTTHPKNLVYLNANFNRWLKRADGIVSISEQSTREVQEIFPSTQGRITTIHLGVDRAIFYPRRRDEVDIELKNYSISKDYFLVVGNIEPRKNISTLLDAYRQYADGINSPAQLVIIGGDGWKNEDLLLKINQMIKEGYDIHRPKKYVEDSALPMLYSGARAVLHIALHEGFGLPPVEAQACGTPVIVSNIPVLHEVLGLTGVTFVPPTDVEAIANAMQISLPVKSARKVAIKPELTWDNTVEKLLAFADIIKR